MTTIINHTVGSTAILNDFHEESVTKGDVTSSQLCSPPPIEVEQAAPPKPTVPPMQPFHVGDKTTCDKSIQTHDNFGLSPSEMRESSPPQSAESALEDSIDLDNAHLKESMLTLSKVLDVYIDAGSESDSGETDTFPSQEVARSEMPELSSMIGNPKHTCRRSFAHSLPVNSEIYEEASERTIRAWASNPPISEDDAYILSPRAQTMARNFAMEHRIFLRAILDMLTERDQLANQIGSNDPHTIKTGSLRKASHRIKGRWKAKYVELRKGIFSYYDYKAQRRQSQKGGQSSKSNHLRKDILLTASSCTCRAVKMRSVKIRPSNFGNGVVFELRIEGGSRRLWMVDTREERQAWIHAIHEAMIGASVTRGDNFLEYQLEHDDTGAQTGKKILPSSSPYKAFLEHYLNVREATSRAESKDEYVKGLSTLRGKPVTVPVQWIKSQLDDSPAACAFLETEISSGIEQLWKDMLRDSVEINGEVLIGESCHGPDRIMGKLTQLILSSDKSSNQSGIHAGHDWKTIRITEAQAISYARDILLASDRTRSGGDSYYCAENLCLNRDLVVICPCSTEANPLSISVYLAEQDDRPPNMNNSEYSNDVSGWLAVRNKGRKTWKRLFFLLTDGILRCYAKASPKPHELKFQMQIRGAEISESSFSLYELRHENVRPTNPSTARTVLISPKDKSAAREFMFEDELEFSLWHNAFSTSALSIEDNEKAKDDALFSAKEKGITSGNPKCINQQSPPSVDVTVNVSTEYKMCTLDPQGIESEDTWAVLRTSFMQKFRLSGGPTGRICRGDEVVELELLGLNI